MNAMATKPGGRGPSDSSPHSDGSEEEGGGPWCPTTYSDEDLILMMTWTSEYESCRKRKEREEAEEENIEEKDNNELTAMEERMETDSEYTENGSTKRA